MRKVRNRLFYLTALAAVLCFAAGPAFGQGFTVDFSSATGFGLPGDPEKFQTNNVIVNLETTNPLTGGTLTTTIPVNLIWQFDYSDNSLKIAGLPDAGDTACDALPSLEVNVTDALTGAAIEGATVQADNQSATTDGNGEATLTGLSTSSLPVSVSADGYVTGGDTVTLDCGDQESLSVSLLPADDQGTIEGNIRIVLTWGEHPIDLDSHLTAYNDDGSNGGSLLPVAEATQQVFHVFWNNRNECSGSPCDPNIWAMLDVDDVSSYGPETISIVKVDGAFPEGTYYYSVHHYDGSSNIPESDATVKIYQGSTLMGTYGPPAAGANQNPGDNWVWRVVKIVVDSDGDVSYSAAGDYYGPVSSGNVE